MSRGRFTREDWMALGHARLAQEGTEAVKLGAICKAAGLTRGSFYHHFEDHQAFLVAMARAWRTSATEDVAMSLDPVTSAANRMDALTTAAMAIDYRLELGIRELARRLPAVQEIVTQADSARLGLLTELYREHFGLEEDAARAYAYLEYASFSGLILLDPDISEERQRALSERYAETVAVALGQDERPADA